ncbi:MAG: MBL fold metallo-hydrolase [Gammaproteobacteria bacterium]|nr:MBL fold metallo-hydrolase [Gammaproteobacteria bacterium]
MKKILASIVCCLGMCTVFADNHEVVTVEQINEIFGWNFDEVEITTEKVADGLYVLFGAGGNIAASVGEQGVLIVDDMFPELIPKIEKAINDVGGGSIDFAINTHWHFDHAHGNLALGPAGTHIVAHENSVQMNRVDSIVNIVRYKIAQDAYPPEAQPVISFDRSMRFHFNGGVIDLIHAGPAHTAGDTAVIFRQQNAVHFGDVFNNTGYPFIDADSGGTINGMVEFCNAILSELNDESIVIPGHGPVTDVDDLTAYINMLTVVRDRVQALIEEGQSKDQILAAKVTSDFDEEYGPEENSLGFVDRVYTSLMN